MAERRMFAKSIIDSDGFLDMPLSSQALYFHLSMRADDDGFINNPRRIQQSIGSSIDDLKLLVAKKYVIPFSSGIVVIKHWKIHNYIQKDRYRPTKCTEELNELDMNLNGEYSVKDDACVTMDTNRIQVGYKLDTQVRLELGKDRLELGKDRLELGKEKERGTRHFVPPSIEEIKEYCKERNNRVDSEQFFNFYESKGWQIGKNKMKDWKAAVRTWEHRDGKKPKPKNDLDFIDPE